MPWVGTNISIFIYILNAFTMFIFSVAPIWVAQNSQAYLIRQGKGAHVVYERTGKYPYLLILKGWVIYEESKIMDELNGILEEVHFFTGWTI